ncbi:MAG: hypothetical protein GEU75_03095 [Dehalococcoidia bacterium]|nr:hypothetical protein [Dehalococcoidia bacterium]
MSQDELTTSVYRAVLRRALAGDDAANLMLHFEVAVLDRYRGLAGYSLIRTDTVGRLSRSREWSLDFGIAPEEDAVHATWAALLGLPEAEREHWAQHAIVLPASSKFLQMRLNPSACFDDGEVREWER